MSIRYCLVYRPNNKLISDSEQLFNATDLSPVSFGIILSPNPRGKNPANSQINQRTTNENKTSKVSTIKILLDKIKQNKNSKIKYNRNLLAQKLHSRPSTN